MFCANCGAQMDANAKFCPSCGTAVSAPAAPVSPAAPSEPVAPVTPTPTPSYYSAPSEPVYTPNPSYYTIPTVAATPVVSAKDKATGFVGMGLGIGGLFFAVIGILYTLIGMVEPGLGFGFAFAFSLFSLPLSIVGKILCGKSEAAGNVSTPCSVGGKLGLAGIIVTAAMLFLGFINLMV